MRRKVCKFLGEQLKLLDFVHLDLNVHAFLLLLIRNIATNITCIL